MAVVQDVEPAVTESVSGSTLHRTADDGHPATDKYEILKILIQNVLINQFPVQIWPATFAV